MPRPRRNAAQFFDKIRFGHDAPSARRVVSSPRRGVRPASGRFQDARDPGFTSRDRRGLQSDHRSLFALFLLHATGAASLTLNRLARARYTTLRRVVAGMATAA